MQSWMTDTEFDIETACFWKQSWIPISALLDIQHHDMYIFEYKTEY